MVTRASDAESVLRPVLEPDERLERCVVCGGKGFHSLFVAETSRYTVARCQGCGLVFYNPRPSQARLREYYESRYYSEENDHILRRYVREPSGDDERFDLRLESIEARVGRGTLLDIGCAAGAFMARAAPRGWDVRGVEMSPAAAAIARERSGMEVRTGTVREAAFDAEGFDAATMWDVVEHLGDPLGELKAVFRVIRSGGALFLTTQNVDCLGFLRDREKWYQFDPMHLLHFSPRSLKRLLRQAGFQRVEIVPLGRFEPNESAQEQPGTPVRRPSQTAGYWRSPSRIAATIRWRLGVWLPLKVRMAQGYWTEEMMAAVAWK